MPIATPAMRCPVRRSSPAAAITSTANSGVVALSTAASPLETIVCAIRNSENGMTLLTSPMTAKGSQSAARFGSVPPSAAMTASRHSAPPATRTKATVSGGTSRSATPLKKKEPPHSTESRTSSTQSCRCIGRGSLPDCMQPVLVPLTADVRGGAASAPPGSCRGHSGFCLRAVPPAIAPGRVPARTLRQPRRHEVEAVGAERLAAQDARQRHPAARPQAEPRDRLVGIIGAAWQVAAARPDQRRQCVTINGHQRVGGDSRQTGQRTKVPVRFSAHENSSLWSAEVPRCVANNPRAESVQYFAGKVPMQWNCLFLYQNVLGRPLFLTRPLCTRRFKFDTEQSGGLCAAIWLTALRRRRSRAQCAGKHCLRRSVRKGEK